MTKKRKKLTSSQHRIWSPDWNRLIKVDKAATPEENTWQYLAYSKSAKQVLSYSRVGFPQRE